MQNNLILQKTERILSMKTCIQYLNQICLQKRDFGILIFRLIFGGMFIWHGFPKITGGIETWTALGQTMGVFGIHFAPAFWGFMSGCSEFVGGLLLFLGLFYRFASALLAINLLTAFSSQMLQDKGLFKSSQSLEDASSVFAAIFIGPGRFSLDSYLGFIQSKHTSL